METGKRNKESMAAAGLFIGLGLIVLGFLLKSAIETYKASERVVYVKGLSEREVKADRVIWPIVYKEVGDDLLALYNNIDKKNNIICEYLQQKGLDQSEITISAPKIIDMKAERYGSNDKPYRYNITSIITVSSDKVDKVREMIFSQTELLKKEIAIVTEEYQYQTQYLFTKLNDIKPEMIEEATKNARQSAEKFAKDSGSDLGKIKTASQGQFSINERDGATPHIKSVRVVTTVQYYLKD